MAVSFTLKPDDIALEVNTSGYEALSQHGHYPTGRCMDIPLTVGSDARHPRQFSRFFDRFQHTLAD